MVARDEKARVEGAGPTRSVKVVFASRNVVTNVGLPPRNGLFVTIADPQGGRYWWILRDVQSSGNLDEMAKEMLDRIAVYAGADNLIVFSATATQLLIGLGQERLKPGEDATALAQAAQARQVRAGAPSGGAAAYQHRVSLSPPLARSFFSHPDRSVSYGDLAILAAKRLDDGWQIDVGNGVHAATVTLSEEFVLVKAEQTR